jgi:hypothetical protein
MVCKTAVTTSAASLFVDEGLVLLTKITMQKCSLMQTSTAEKCRRMKRQ